VNYTPKMRRFSIIALLLILPVATQATVLIPIEFRELVAAAPVIVHGRVVDVRSAFVDGRRAVETFVTIEAGEYLKGDLGGHVTFRVPGGQLGRYRTIFVGAPEFREGDELVLFLKSGDASLPRIIGLSQGAFRVVPDARSGRRIVTTPIVMGKADGGPQPVVRGDATRKPVSIESFRELVRQVMASQGAAQ
jgi:hypothetical protein